MLPSAAPSSAFLANPNSSNFLFNSSKNGGLSPPGLLSSAGFENPPRSNDAVSLLSLYSIARLNFSLIGKVPSLTLPSITSLVVFASNNGFDFLWINLLTILLTPLLLISSILKSSVYVKSSAAAEKLDSGVTYVLDPLYGTYLDTASLSE